MSVSSEHIRSVLVAAGRGKRTKRSGLPDNFPEMIANSNGIVNAATVLRAAKKAFEGGYNDALIVAMNCLVYSGRKETPRWILAAWFDAANLWRQGMAKSIDDALGLQLPRTKADTRAFREFHVQIYLDIMDADKQGIPIDAELFREIGRHYGDVSDSTVKRAYRDVKKRAERVSEKN